MKKLIYMMGLILLMASCSDDYTDWATPIHNDGKPLEAELTVAEAPAIDFATLEDNLVNIFTPTISIDENDEVICYTVKLVNGENSVELIADPEGNVEASVLQEKVEALYGKAPTPREIEAHVVRVSINGQNFITDKEFKVNVTLSAPHISENYYVIGGALDWKKSAVDRTQKFKHSDQNVYDDPIFTIRIDAAFKNGQREDTWFAFGDDETCEAIAVDDWSKILGTANGNGSTELTGTLAPRTELGNDGSICMPASDNAVAYKITLNMMEYTYTIEPVPAEPEQWYLIGTCIGNGTWDNNGVQDVGVSLFPLTHMGGDVMTYVGYFKAGQGFKLIKTPGSWDDQWGAKDGSYVKNDGGSGDIKVEQDGWYVVLLNTKDDILTIMKTSGVNETTYTQMGIAGSFNKWSFQEIEKCPGSDHLWKTEVNFTENQELKFLTDANWTNNWGAANFPQGIGVKGGANIPVAAGSYVVIFNDQTGGYNFIEK